MKIDYENLHSDSFIDMKFMTEDSGMTEQWFYRMISHGHFPKPIKLGRSSRWRYGEYTQWKKERIIKSRNVT